jgi:hypothetical protein
MSCGWEAACRGRPTGSCSRFLTARLLMNSHQFLCYRSIRSGFADSLCRRVWTVILQSRIFPGWSNVGLQSTFVNLHGAGFGGRRTLSQLGRSIRLGSGLGPRRARYCFRKGWLACKCRLALEDISSLLCAYG